MDGVTPIVIAFPVFNRPELLRRVLESWSRVRGIENAVMEFHCEPGCAEARELCRSADFCRSHLFVNPTRLGHHLNVLSSMNSAFTRTDYAIQALDDFVVSTDILELHQWHRTAYASDPTVLALTSGRDVPAQSGAADAVWRCQLIGALSGFHRHKWQMLADRWQEGSANWWEWVNLRWLQRPGGYDVLFPALSRADDIGGGGTPSSCFLPDPSPVQYYEVKGSRERARGFTRYVEFVG